MKVEDIKFQSAQHVLDEIYNMNVKGGSPFGRAAAWAYKLTCEQETLDSFDTLEARMQELSDKLHELKPTMATIRNSSVFAARRSKRRKRRSSRRATASLSRPMRRWTRWRKTARISSPRAAP